MAYLKSFDFNTLKKSHGKGTHKHTNTQTDRRTSRLLDRIGPVGRFGENLSIKSAVWRNLSFLSKKKLMVEIFSGSHKTLKVAKNLRFRCCWSVLFCISEELTETNVQVQFRVIPSFKFHHLKGF